MSSADPGKETCWTLIRGAAGGNESDRDEFARRYLATVRAYLAARWQASPLLAEVDDAVQEVFVACFRDDGVLDRADPLHGGGFRAFLYGVTRNVALHTERARARKAKHLEGGNTHVELSPAQETTLSRIFDREYARSIMRMAGEGMEKAAAVDPAGQRRVELLRLRFEDELPIREIAKLWGEDPAHLHREYARAGKEFRKALAEAVLESECCPPQRLELECERLLSLLRK